MKVLYQTTKAVRGGGGKAEVRVKDVNRKAIFINKVQSDRWKEITRTY